MTFMLIILDIVILMEYFTPTLMLAQFNLNIFINGLVIQSSQILASVASFFMISRCPRKVVTYVVFTIILLISTLLIFIWDQDKNDTSDTLTDVIVLGCVFIIDFAITIEFNFFTIYFNELYPAQIRLVGIGFI